VWHGSTSTHLVSHNACCCHTVETVRPYIHTQQSGNCNDYTEMYKIFNPEIPGLEPPNPGISGLRNMSGIRGSGSWNWNPYSPLLVPFLSTLHGVTNEGSFSELSEIVIPSHR
jgi:hypothetical protein